MTRPKSLEKVDLPREKLEKYGPEKLKDFELLAILLGSGIKGKNVLVLAKSILKRIDDVGIHKITFDDIRSIKGIGLAKATQILAQIELARRFSNDKTEILTPSDIWKLCSDFRNSKKRAFGSFLYGHSE